MAWTPRTIRKIAHLLLFFSLGACAPVEPQGAPKSAPTGISATGADGYNVLNWNSVEDATTYQFYWSVFPGVTPSNGFKVRVSARDVIHGGLINGTTTYYVVQAVNAAGPGPLSSEFSATPANGTASTDPLFSQQWALLNTGQSGANGSSATPGEDINVKPLWDECSGGQPTCRGEGVRVAVVDSDLEIGHEDLIANVATGMSHDYVTGGTDPTGKANYEFHGTAVASIVAARDLNGKGLRGVAPRANLVGYNFLASPTFSSQSDAMTRNISSIAVSNNSWGTADGTGLLSAAPFTWRNAIEHGLAHGRGGKGTIYVWSAGNGGVGDECRTSSFHHNCVDNSNYDGYANYRGVISVGAVNTRGEASSYTEAGANVAVVAPGGEYCDTTAGVVSADASGTKGLNPHPFYAGFDLFNQSYTRCMNGTSAASPHVSGVAALMIQANPELSWREVRYLLATTARKNDASHSGWTTNGAGFYINHLYGFGTVDSQAAVAAARNFSTPFGAYKTHNTGTRTPGLSIPDNNATGVTDSFSVSGSGISKIEYVEVIFRAPHGYSGDLEVTLTHTDTGTASRLSEKHFCEPINPNSSSPTLGDCDAYDNWVFGNIRHLDESANGTWTLRVRDLDPGGTGTFEAWSIRFYGR